VEAVILVRMEGTVDGVCVCVFVCVCEQQSAMELEWKWGFEKSLRHLPQPSPGSHPQWAGGSAGPLQQELQSWTFGNPGCASSFGIPSPVVSCIQEGRNTLRDTQWGPEDMRR
jgi:hypothetical protein